MHFYGRAMLVAASLLLSATALRAASLQVSPVSVQVPQPASAATVNLRNDGETKLNVQIRVFRWKQENGKETLEPTQEVVASPPMVTLASGADYTVRLVRVSKRRVAAEESYRLLVDELPSQASRKNRTVTLVMRYSIPVFFQAREARDPSVAWSVERHKGRLYLSAVNRGDRHIRVSDLKLRDGRGTVVPFGGGLNGYVLGRSRVWWEVPAKPSKLNVGQPVFVSAQGDQGPINASTSTQ